MSLEDLDIVSLINRGYFPKELPPQFTTSSFSSSISSNLPKYNSYFSTYCKTKCVTHNIPRVGKLRRKISIPNPISFFKLSKTLVENKQEIKNLVEIDPYSLTKPVIDKKKNRAITPSNWFDELPKIRAKKRVGTRYVLKADISKFYHSIYTHSIPWAIHGKEFAKTNRGMEHFGNKLDADIRNGQDGQTVGIPIGPDSSLLVSEIILSQIGQNLYEKTKLDGFRFADDYEISCNSQADVERAISVLETTLSEFELQLNPSKLKVVELPDEIDSFWATDLNTTSISEASEGSQYHSLLNFFNKITKSINCNPDSSIAKYCISRLGNINIFGGNKEFVFNFIIQCYILEPSAIPRIIEYLNSRDADIKDKSYNKEVLKNAAMQVIEKGKSLYHTNEIAWALWTCIVFNLPIDNDIFSSIINIEDSIVALVALDAYNRGLVGAKIEFPFWTSHLTRENLCEEMWLLAYESTIKGWLVPPDHNFITSSNHFKILKDKNVLFYDNPTDPKSLVLKLPELEMDDQHKIGLAGWEAYFI